MTEKLLRDYQTKAVDSVFAEFDRGIKRTMLVSATGTGKTTMAGYVATRLDSGQRILWLCHREELAFQARDALREITGREVHLEMGEYKASHRNAPIVVAMVQSLTARKSQYGPDAFQFGFVDECFPAGTLVDGRPIETIKVGDLVNSFNHETNRIEKRRVTRTSSRSPKTLVKVFFSDGRCEVCTEEHPFYVRKNGIESVDYVPAKHLSSGDHVYGYETQVGSYRVADHSALHVLRSDGGVLSSESQQRTDVESCGPSGNVLFAGVCTEASIGQGINCDGQYKPQVRLRSDAAEQPVKTIECEGEDFRHDEGSKTCEERRERSGNAIPTTVDDGKNGSSTGIHSANKNEAGPGIPNALQVGFGGSGTSTVCGNRWIQSCPNSEATARLEENGISEITRVDRVEIQEQTRDRTFGGLCPNGLVYNFEVEGNHNYFVNGILVHNCHHATAKTYMSLIQYFSGVKNWLGLTATPKRADGVAMGKVFDSVAYRFEIGAAVDLGWLVAPKQRMATCREIDLRKVDTVAGDLHKGQLKAQLMQQSVVDQIARKTIAVADGRQTIVFCQTVDQSHALSRVFSLLGERAVAIDGKTPTIIRRGRVADFRDGKARFLCQVSICTEGFDVPEAEVTAMARPTKSQSLYTQSVGRILRPITPPSGLDGTARRLEIANSVKPHATVLDFVGNTGRHRLVNTGDLLGGEYDDEVRAMAVQKAQSIDGDVDMHKLLEECKVAISAKPKVLRVQGDESTGLYKRFAFLLYRYQAHPCDALGIDKSLPDRVVEKNMAYGQSLTTAMSDLRGQRLHENEIGQMSNRQQVFVARILESREDAQLCTYPQLRILHRHGYSADMDRRQASQKINEIQTNGNMRPVCDGPNETLLRLISVMAARTR